MAELGQRIAERIDSYFEGATLRPAILHGDLWSGNIAQAGGGAPRAGTSRVPCCRA